jgi:hypothetical protein
MPRTRTEEAIAVAGIGAQCPACKHLRPGLTCDAFPDRMIPEAILTGRFDHRKPFPGDRGIRYEPYDPTDDTEV